MNIIERAKGIILKPKEEWVKIKGESTPVMTLFMNYVLILAAIPAVAQFIGYALIGRRILSFGTFRWPIGTALVGAVVSYVLSVVSIYVAGFVINLLAPSFGSKPNLENAMKLVVYSMTPMWVAGIFYIFPVLGLLAGLVGLYGLYVLYLGFSNPMMDTPQDKVLPYLVVSILIVAGLWIVVGVIGGTVYALRSVTGF
ncbi:MAG: Yip1 family protein [Candidatus Aminicenantales bacterium]